MLQNTERVLQISQLLEEGNTAVLARLPSEGAGSWAAPRSPGKCRGKLQSAQLRLLLCFLQHDRLAEHCPPKLREWGLLEDIGGCITVHELLTDAFWEQAGRTAGLGDEALLATIRAACTEPEDPTVLDFDGKSICDAGATVVGAALGAMDAPLPFEAIYLDNNELTAAGMRSIAEGMGRGRLPNLREVGVGGNPALGDGGAAALAEALADCASLEELHFASCGVGGVGFAAVAACVPQWPKLQKLFAYQNPGPSDALGRALAAALPSLPDAESVSLWESGLGEGATAEVRAAAAGSGVELDLTLQVGDGQDSESSSDDGQGDDY
eukprot:COSAG04_NODE_1170_length_7960_cov_2.783743_7_plen_325_part_00